MSESIELQPAEVRITALGGLGEIGLNMMVLESGTDLLLIDCGLMFPEAYMLGIDLVLPDISAIRHRVKDIRALVLTHGHEDHIGAIPYLLPELGFPPIYGTGLTLGLLRNKLEEHDLLDRVELRRVSLPEEVSLGPFAVEFFRVTHSIVDGAGLAIRTPAGLIVHTGDFKFDNTPVDGNRTDMARLAGYGDQGVLLLLSDSTNVERPGMTLSERVVGDALAEILPRCPHLVMVSTFSSNIHRVQQAVDAAVACGRKVLLNGRSMVANCTVARQLGYLRIPDATLIDLRDLRDLPRQEVMVITTGSQAEPLSALMRIAMADHKQLELEPGDTVILSSKFIPGNEKAISNLINHLYRRGAEVYYETTSEIHVSGHAGQEELKLMLALTRPRYFVPIHGEYRHLVRHAQLARTMGVAADYVRVLENGQPLVVGPNGLRREARVDSGRVLVDGKGVGDVGAMELRDRRHLANHGLVMAILGVNQKSGEIVYGPEIFTRGFIPEENSAAYLEEMRAVILQVFQEHSLEAVTEWEELRVEVRKALRRLFNRTIKRRPLIVPVIMEL
ncbi:ribonuclease J [Geoalkalibacter ferrihydriticus]|uniref:Ribonuclease J n=2 Tax=Geoalkalibacter ferrihydriticus TaxID=392333 RepID=A0A0C2ECE5_9BACT|nr:ribonuclease J [Geoalkalibacter ferrihydriticus]KIH76263.1 ribonuclease J [Geoalkalibacter ferrihydriticus DSM 17813]SDL23827.1 ribonuclease J [Geoalkalibacter ferrihydriticus]